MSPTETPEERKKRAKAIRARMVVINRQVSKYQDWIEDLEAEYLVRAHELRALDPQEANRDH